MANTVYGYARVSTLDQHEDRQVSALTAAGVPYNNIFIDKKSGRDFDRPAFKRLKRRLKSGDVLFIQSLDRFGRNYSDIMEQWRYICKVKGADIVILDMPLLDTRKDHGSLTGILIADIVLTLLAYVAETERTMIKQRQAEGVEAARKRGVRFGRPELPLPDNFEDVAIRWKNRELSSPEAARLTGFSPSTFRGKASRIYGTRTPLPGRKVENCANRQCSK